MLAISLAQLVSQMRSKFRGFSVNGTTVANWHCLIQSSSHVVCCRVLGVKDALNLRVTA